MPILSPDTTVVYCTSSTTYHRADGDGAKCGGITTAKETEVRCLPNYEPCKDCFAGGVRIHDDDLDNE